MLICCFLSVYYVCQRIITSPDANPSELVEPPFDLEGFTYRHLETVKQEQTYEDTKIQTEVITLETDTDDLSSILEQLAPTVEYSEDGYSGKLTLDHTTIQTQAASYTTKYYTISDTKQFPGLDRNDPSYVPVSLFHPALRQRLPYRRHGNPGDQKV